MKKTKFFALLTTVLAMGLVACNNGPKSSNPQTSSEPAESSVPDGSSEQQNSSSANASSSSAAASSSSAAASSSQAGTSSQTQQGEMTANGIDIVTEGDQIFVKITGTISGFENADAMKMAFGLVAENGSTYLVGSANPADADYNLVPTVNDGAFELKVDISGVAWVGGTYTAMVGPKGAYKAVASTGGTYGTGKAVEGGFRISVRSHNGTIAADELPPVSLTISRLEIEGDQIYHILGGALNTEKLTKEAFEAKHPYVVYETTIAAQWKQNVMGSSTKTDLVTVSVDAEGNALIKTNITSLPADAYNIKINLSADTPTDTKMDAIIDETERPVAFGMYDYICYADYNQSDKAHIYGNCGLYINAANRYVNAGEKFADLQPVKSKDGEIAYEMVAADCVGQNNPTYGSSTANKATRLGKNGILSDEWEINGIRSGEYEVYIKGSYSSGNGGSYWSGAQNVEHAQDQEKEKGNNKTGDTYNPAARYKVGIDSLDPVDLASEQTYADCGLAGDANGGWTKAAMAKVTIPEGSEKFTMTSNDNGYAIWVFAVRLVRVGNWNRPATEANFTAGVMRVECESYHEASSEPTIATEGGATYISHMTSGWPQFNVSYKINFAEAKTLKLKLHYAWYSGQWGKNGACEFRLDSSDTKIKDATGSDNLGQADANMTGEWLDAESAAFEVTAGEHTIKFTIPGGCEISWDYFDLIVVE